MRTSLLTTWSSSFVSPFRLSIALSHLFFLSVSPSVCMCVSSSWFLLITICGRWNKGGVFFMWLAWSQCCHCNVCLPIALWGEKMECTFLSSFCSFSVSIASLFSPTPPSFSLSSVAIYPLSHFFFTDAPTLSIHFISLQFSAPFLLFFACRSSWCHQVFCRRGRKAKGFRREPS